MLSQFAIGILWVSAKLLKFVNESTYAQQDWHPLTWLYLLSGSKAILGLESWGWFIEWTPAFLGSGMLVGMNVAVSFVGGSILAW